MKWHHSCKRASHRTQTFLAMNLRNGQKARSASNSFNNRFWSLNARHRPFYEEFRTAIEILPSLSKRRLLTAIIAYHLYAASFATCCNFWDTVHTRPSASMPLCCLLLLSMISCPVGLASCSVRILPWLWFIPRFSFANSLLDTQSRFDLAGFTPLCLNIRSTCLSFLLSSFQSHFLDLTFDSDSLFPSP